jgi:hypothetical protein
VATTPVLRIYPAEQQIQPGAVVLGPPVAPRFVLRRYHRRLHGDLRDLDLGQRPCFYRGCELELMGAFQDWDAGVLALQAERPDLGEWATSAMANARQEVADKELTTLPAVVVHGVPDQPGDGRTLGRDQNGPLRLRADRAPAQPDRDGFTVATSRS